MFNVLLVDDDLELTELLSELLVLEGFNIQTACNGLEALDKIENQHFDLILLDVMMPKLNGVETLRRLRQKYNIPVLMLSARDDEIDRVLGLELGADDYLPKPFNDRELIARIRAILRRTANLALQADSIVIPQYEEPQDILEVESVIEETIIGRKEIYIKGNNRYISFAGIELNLTRQQAKYEHEVLDLTSTEFLLLILFIRNEGDLVSRELLSEEILGKPLTPFDRAIDMHMSNLRRKLPDRSDNLQWFKTLRGRGYVLVPER